MQDARSFLVSDIGDKTVPFTAAPRGTGSSPRLQRGNLDSVTEEARSECFSL
ncbi:hypothetical protein GK047_13000 [Paenibacillus sp. SYP-B3998]|uniref:Uncharacterized protein n=1 Tax=Paenibacillus sp. SYP-B3998 TaxID=2678564 RepID=A0A6G3ZZB9_9BACL|nr:hypothetical protein [Paenibacillus sp. SYP-B3998]NEW06921.1 hypothetical protein [Paenibacillus sp. SYP-B3998]